ncbi:hypothetical protein [Microbacterium sp. P02]|uniref:hypothetical protein n=1 Tax=Microbacterium sp. P02 TaxID=3366260 RepID=UPI00366B1AB2
MDKTLTDAAQRTLFEILHHPTSQNISWDAVVTLLEQVADVEATQEGSQLIVRMNNVRLTLHKPSGTPVSEQSLLEVRRMLRGAGLG